MISGDCNKINDLVCGFKVEGEEKLWKIAINPGGKYILQYRRYLVINSTENYDIGIKLEDLGENNNELIRNIGNKPVIIYEWRE